MLSEEIFSRMSGWLADAKAQGSFLEPWAMNLATVDSSGQPHSRIVLLKGFSPEGLVFYTNLDSPKSHDLESNPKAALCFHWMPMMRQLRIEGIVSRVSDAQADAYFASRPRESQIGAWASHQSQTLENRAQLEKAVQEWTVKFEGKDVPRPEFWSGWKLDAHSVEFWQQGDNRLHDRELYTRTGSGWNLTRLYP